MVLITVEFHAGSVIGLMIALPEELPLNDSRYLLGTVGYFVLSYWAVFLLAAISDANEPAHSWRVWGAWLLITFPFAVGYLSWLFGNVFAGNALAIIGIKLIWLSPIVTLVGAVAGYLLWRLYQRLRTVLRERGKA
jgi:hypothetical protein